MMELAWDQSRQQEDDEVGHEGKDRMTEPALMPAIAGQYGSDSINSGNISDSDISDSIKSSNGGEAATSFTVATKGQYQCQQ